MDRANELFTRLKSAGIRVKVDDSDNSPGWKFAEHEMKGVPVRLEIGPRDIENNECILVTRHDRKKTVVSLDSIEKSVAESLQIVHDGLYNKALSNREARTYDCNTADEINSILSEKGDGYVRAMWCGHEECEDRVKELTGVGTRCIPFDQIQLSDKCVCCKGAAKHMVYWAKAY